MSADPLTGLSIVVAVVALAAFGACYQLGLLVRDLKRTRRILLRQQLRMNQLEEAAAFLQLQIQGPCQCPDCIDED